MEFENKYPYTDFHEMNLDWILKVVKRLETEWPEFKTTLETEWNEYKDGLTGEGGEWPTFKAQVETTVNNLIHDIVGPYNENLDYQQGMFCYHEGKVYKCLQPSSAAFPRPFNSYNWYSYENQNTNSVVNDLFNYLTTSLTNQDTEIFRWIQNTAAQWDETTEYKAGDYCSALVGGAFIPSSWRYYRCLQDCTNIYIFDTNYWKEVVFASDVAERIADYKQAMQDQYDQFLEDYQRTFGVVQVRGSSTTDVMSQKAVSDELQAHDDMIDNLIKDIAPVYDSTKAYKIGNLLTYLGKQYYCIADAPAGTLPTNTTYFEEKSVADIIEMIKQGAIVTGHSQVTDNLTPYSEDSGAIQDTPFISQGTGTGNNSVIVTTGDQAKQLEKLGTGYVYNQQFPISTTSRSVTTNGVTFIDNRDGSYTVSTGVNGATADTSILMIDVLDGVKANHTYLMLGFISKTSEYLCQDRYDGVLTYPSNNNTYGIYTTTRSGRINCRFIVLYGAIISTAITFKPKLVDLTQWFNGNDNIPQDLLDNPSHFSWYYNGELTYNTGEIKHGNGVKLVCTRQRNLWDEDWELGGISWSEGTKYSANDKIRSKNYNVIIPNRPIYALTGTGGYDLHFYDSNKNHIGAISVPSSGIVNVPSNASYFMFACGTTYGTTYKHDITITPYYTPAEGGEGYDQYYPYEEPDIIDTGSEQLGAFDKKTPDGVITRATGTYTFTGNEGWSPSGSGYTTALTGLSNLVKKPSTNNVVFNWQINSAGLKATSADKLYSGVNTSGIGIVTTGGIFIGSDDYANISRLTGKTIEFELAIPTTEQGTSFRQYAGINDYGIMYWLDSNDELVSIPQGCKIQYPVNYKGFIDDAYMYTNGDATKIALDEDITDAALNARGYYKMQDLLSAFGSAGFGGGILKWMLAQNKSLDFNNVDCKSFAELTWTRESASAGTYYIFAARIVGKSVGENANNILTTYCKTHNGNRNDIPSDGWVTCYNSTNSDYIAIRADSYTTVDAFVQATSTQLIAYEKA